MFEFTTDNLYQYEFDNSPVYVVDDFYNHPDKIVSLLESAPRGIHKEHDVPSYNGKYFYDERHRIQVEELIPMISWIESLTGQKFKDFNTHCHLFTNWMKWEDVEFNTYKNHYWYPHLDFGFTAIVYLNKEPSGTNLYLNKGDDLENVNEHYEPWRNSNDWELIHTIESKFNRLVIFDAGKFIHGLQFNPVYFNKPRLNQVMFFEYNNADL